MIRFHVKTKTNVYIEDDVTNVLNAIKVCIKENNIKLDDIICVFEVDDYEEQEIENAFSPYQWKRNSRSHSPREIELNDMTLEEIECPICGKKRLQQLQYGKFGWEYDYRVECDDCGFVCPIQLSDCGEQIVMFKEWVAAYELAGKPKGREDEDWTLYFHPHSSRKQSEKWRKSEHWYLD